MLQVEKTTDMKDAFGRLVSIQKIAKERIWAREYISIESSKKGKEKKDWKKNNPKYPRTGTTTKAITYMLWEYQKREKEQIK